MQVLTILKWLSSLLFSFRVREIWPGPGSLCFVVAGICSFLAALILLGLDSLDEKERCHAPAKIAMQDMRDCFLCAALHVLAAGGDIEPYNIGLRQWQSQ